MLPSSGIYRGVLRTGTEVSEECITSNFRVETSVHIRTTRRYIQQEGNIYNYRCENLIFENEGSCSKNSIIIYPLQLLKNIMCNILVKSVV
jgi:hypothetical protein